jgi:hypothetical protein
VGDNRLSDFFRVHLCFLWLIFFQLDRGGLTMIINKSFIKLPLTAVIAIYFILYPINLYAIPAEAKICLPLEKDQAYKVVVTFMPSKYPAAVAIIALFTGIAAPRSEYIEIEKWERCIDIPYNKGEGFLVV